MQQSFESQINMKLRPIKTESDYNVALKEIERLFNAAPNSPECDRAFQKSHHKLRSSTLRKFAIAFYMFYYANWLSVCQYFNY
jgi:hypothetical protein